MAEAGTKTAGKTMPEAARKAMLEMVKSVYDDNGRR